MKKISTGKSIGDLDPTSNDVSKVYKFFIILFGVTVYF